jgi:hypothetical protein
LKDSTLVLDARMTTNRARSVVMISLDTLRYDCIGACPQKGHLASWGFADRLRTPNLDRFCAESAYFTQARSPAPYTTSSHASIMTGLYPNHHGVRSFYRWALAPAVGTLAQELKARGYLTVAVLERGRDSALRTGTDVLRGFDEVFVDEADAAARCRAAGRPCLFFLHTMDVHAPYCWSGLADVNDLSDAWPLAEKRVCSRLGVAEPPAETRASKMAFYRWASGRARQTLDERACVELFLDWYVHGVNWFDEVRWPRIVQALQDAGLYEDALIVLFADHGEAALADFNGPPISHQPSLLEDVIRVPLLLHGPQVGRGEDARAAALIDVAPTVMDYLGMAHGRLGSEGRTDGRSLLAAPNGGPRALICEGWHAPPEDGGRAPRHEGGPVHWQELERAVPNQVGAVCGSRKVIWQWGAGRLRRFKGPRQVARERLRALARRLSRSRVLRRARKAAGLWRDGPGGARVESVPHPDSFPWRDGMVFSIDLASDPFEARPRRIVPSRAERGERELHGLIRAYWEEGVYGPLISLTTDEEDAVVDNLRALGYVD